MVFRLGEELVELKRFAVYEFDLRQFKAHMVDYLSAQGTEMKGDGCQWVPKISAMRLDQAVVKRQPRQPLGAAFIGLSPGYDSGALQAL